MIHFFPFLVFKIYNVSKEKKAKRINFKEFSLEQVIFHVLGVNKPFNELEISEDELVVEEVSLMFVDDELGSLDDVCELVSLSGRVVLVLLVFTFWQPLKVLKPRLNKSKRLLRVLFSKAIFNQF